MKNAAARTRKTKVKEFERFDRRKVDFTKFKPEPPPRKLAESFVPAGRAALFPVLFLTIETLSVTKTVGSGRTNLTFIMPTIVQADAATPYAGFNRTVTPSRNPIIQMHFQPSGYGITAVSNYVMSFAIESFGQSRFNLTGYAGHGTLSNNGTKILNGKTTVSLGFHNVRPSDEIYGYLEQTSGNAWSFYNVRARFPYPDILQA